MKTQITLAVLASVSLVLAALLAAPAMTSSVFAGGHDGDDDDDDDDDHDKKSHGCEKYSQGYKSSDGKCFHRD
jgi:hypothetical protein